MADTVKKKKGLFAKIETRDDALKTVRECALGFFFVAALQGVLGAIVAPALLFDAVILAILAAILMKWRSRTAAILLMLMTVFVVVITVLNRIGATSQGGTNVFLAVFMGIVAFRAVQATFLLHGRFAASAVATPTPGPRDSARV
jgi:hypothetical protein